MASEIHETVSLSASKGGASINSVGLSGSALATFDMDGADMAMATQPVGTAAEAIAIPGDLTPVGTFCVKNMDPANYCEISFDSGSTWPIKLRANRKALFQPAAAMHCRFNTAAGSIAFWVVEE